MRWTALGLILSLGLNEELGTEIKDSEEGAGNIDVVVTDLKNSDKPSKPPTDKLESRKVIDKVIISNVSDSILLNEEASSEVDNLKIPLTQDVPQTSHPFVPGLGGQGH